MENKNVSEGWLHDDFYVSYEEYVESKKDYQQSQDTNNDKFFRQTVFDTSPENASLSFQPPTEAGNFIAPQAITLNTQITTDLMSEIQLFCKSRGITELYYALACLFTVLHRYLGTDDILIAVPVSTHGTKFQNTDGLFVNTVLFRYKINSAHSLGQHIMAVSKSWMEAFVHSKYPLDKVNQMIWKKIGVGVSSLCSTMFNFATFQDKSDEYIIEPMHAKHVN